MKYDIKTSSDKRMERLKSENENLRSKTYFLELENKRLSSECESLYKYIEEVKDLEIYYNSEIKKIKEAIKKYKKETESYIAMKRDYQKAMDKFLDSLVISK